MEPLRVPVASLVALALSLLAGACGAPARQPATPTAAAPGPALALTQAQPAASAASDYVIGPGDALNVFVYRAPELSVNVPVRPDGRISMPLVSDIDAAGRTPMQLGREIAERLKKYVIDPNVTVTVTSFVGPASRQVRVIGEATTPKAIPYREGMTVLDVLIETGGLTRYAAGNRAQILRREARGEGNGEATRAIRVRLNDLLRDGDVSQDMAVQPGDTVVIPQGWF